MQNLSIHTAEMPQHKSPVTYVIVQGLQQWQDMLARVRNPHNSQDKIWQLTITILMIIFYNLWYTNKNRTAAVSARKQLRYRIYKLGRISQEKGHNHRTSTT